MLDYFEEIKEIQMRKKIYEYLLAFHIGDQKYMEKLKGVVKMACIQPLANSDSKDKWTYKLIGGREE